LKEDVEIPKRFFSLLFVLESNFGLLYNGFNPVFYGFFF